VATLKTSVRSIAGTRKVARALAERLGPGDVVVLVGELGAGKTTFVQGLADGLGVPRLREVVSPTYTLVNEHLGGRVPLVHLDLYRLTDAESAHALGLAEQLARTDAVIAVEWGEKFPELLPRRLHRVTLRGLGKAREIEVSEP
jgi:tRNA threonylcarbamoyladenosine biosynthesis protein TsaE